MWQRDAAGYPVGQEVRRGRGLRACRKEHGPPHGAVAVDESGGGGEVGGDAEEGRGEVLDLGVAEGGDEQPVEAGAWMVKRSENGVLDAAWLQGHGLPVGPEVMGRSSRVRRVAPCLQMQPDEPVEASYGLAKTATLTILRRPRSRT